MDLTTTPGKYKLVGTGHHKKFYFQGNEVDLSNISEEQAEALANNKRCTFLQLADNAAAAKAAEPAAKDEKK